MAREPAAPLSPSRKQNVDFLSPVKTTPPVSRKRSERENALFSPDTPTLTTPSPGTQTTHSLSVIKRFDRMIPIRPFDEEDEEVEAVVRGNLGGYKKSKPPQKGSEEWFAQKNAVERELSATPADWFQKLILTLEMGGGVLEKDEVRYDKKLSFKRDLLTHIQKFTALNETDLAKKIQKFYAKNKDCSEEMLFARAKIFALQLRHEEKIPSWNVALNVKKFHLKNPLFPLPYDEDELLSALSTYDTQLDTAIQHLSGNFSAVLKEERLAIADTIHTVLSLCEKQNLIAKSIATNEELIEKHHETLDILSKTITEINEELAFPSTALTPSASQETVRAKREERTRKENKARYLLEEFTQIETQLRSLRKENRTHNKTFTQINNEVSKGCSVLKTSHENNWNRFEQTLSDWMNPVYIQKLLTDNLINPAVRKCLQPAINRARAFDVAFCDYLQATVDGIDQDPTEMNIMRAYLDFYVSRNSERQWSHPEIFDALLATQQPVLVPAHQLLKPPSIFERYTAIRRTILEGITTFIQNGVADHREIQDFISTKISALENLQTEIPEEKQKAKSSIQEYISFLEKLLDMTRSIPDVNILFEELAAQLNISVHLGNNPKTTLL